MATIHYSPHNEINKGRKRRLSEDEDMGDASTANGNLSPRSIVQRHRRVMREADKSLEIKRHKSGVQKRSVLATSLAALDKNKLIDIVQHLFNAHPEIRQDIISCIPAPTVHSAAAVLNNLEKRLADSFPYNRHGPSRNDYTFSRVRSSLTELINTVTQYADHFTSPLVFPTSCFSYLDIATHVAHRLPNWDNEDNNQLKRNLYQDLNNYWKRAIQSSVAKLRDGETYSAQTVAEWAKCLAQHNSYTEGLLDDAVHEFSRCMGFMIGLPHNDAPRDIPICHHPAVQNDIARLSSPPRVVGYADARR